MLGHLIAEVTTDENDDTMIALRWIFETPNKAILQWVREQLAHLKSIESQVHKRVGELKDLVYEDGNLDHEQETIVDLFEGYVEFLELALKHKDDLVAVTYEENSK